MVLERVQEWRLAQNHIVCIPFRQLDAHVVGQLVYLIDINLCKLHISRVVVRILGDEQPVLEHQLDKLIVYLEALLDSTICQMNKWLVNYFD